jgi:tripartite-type tricarboxylate transporter receptor subunit TctC
MALQIMSLMSTRSVIAALTTITLAATIGTASAQSYPTKPIQLVIPFSAGGSTDSVGRAIGQELGARLGQPVVVENKAGAGGTIGSAYVAKAKPDGYTLMIGTVSTSSVVGSLYKNLPYDPIESFTPITEIASTPQVLVVNPAVNIKSVPQLISHLKAKPESLFYATGGQGTAAHLASELFSSMADVKMVHVPYKGSAPAIADTLANQTNLAFDVVMTSVPHVQSGKLNALAVTGKTRSPLLPDVPTMQEAGLPGYEAMVWFGVVGPAGMPADITNKLQQELAEVLKTPKIQELLNKQGAQVVASSPEAFKAHIEAEASKWSKIVQERNITAP